MTRLSIALALIAMLAVPAFAAPRPAPTHPLYARDVLQQHNRTVTLTYDADSEATIACAAGMLTDVALEGGETVNEGFGAPNHAWQAKRSYSGGKSDVAGARAERERTPHLLFSAPNTVGSRTNIVVTTDRRTYHLLLIAVADRDPLYYRYSYPHVILSRSAPIPLSGRGSIAIAATDEAGPPALTSAADLAPRCVDYAYSVARAPLPADHPAHAKLSKAEWPPAWLPMYICNEGTHTIIAFPPTVVIPDDAPIVKILGPEGDTLCNYSFDDRTRRMTIDNVPSALVLILGSQNEPLRLAIHRTTEANDVPIGAQR